MLEHVRLDISIDTTNAAFESDRELEQVLQDAFDKAKRLINAGYERDKLSLYDTNGNKVGWIDAKLWN